MPVEVNATGLELVVTAVPLSPDAFSPFGSVVQNPKPELHPSAFAGATGPLPFDAVAANQGSAIKYQHVTRMRNLYGQAPSRRPGVAVMNMFVCAARLLERRGSQTGSAAEGFFPVMILERHPFTTQTFVPLGADPTRRFLVVVAPSLPPGAADAALPVPAAADATDPISHARLPGRGLPDLRKLRAFVASGNQAVTYGAGTWHAPMVALGEPGTALDFVVSQFANGVALEDCQEVSFATPSLASVGAGDGGSQAGGLTSPGVAVRIPISRRDSKL